MKKEMKTILQKYIDHIKKQCGEKLDRVILFGSYARGEEHEDSDIDIMILLGVPQEEVYQWERPINFATYDFNMEYDTDIESVVVSSEHFRYWRVAPFYHAVLTEGVVLYDAAA